MGAVVKLIRNAPRASLEEFFTAQSCPLGERLRGVAPEADCAGRLIKAVDELSDEEHAQLTVKAERVSEMADEVGLTATRRVAGLIKQKVTVRGQKREPAATQTIVPRAAVADSSAAERLSSPQSCGQFVLRRALTR